jgi:vitamin B12 transporter
LRTVAVFLLSVLCLEASAQTDTLTANTHSLGEVEVRQHGVAGSVTPPAPVQTMRQEQFTALGMVSLSDAVKKFAGTEVRDYGGIGGMKTVSVRSLGAYHTAVSYDGVTISNTETGQIDIGRFSLDNVMSLSMAIGQGMDQMQTARHYASAGILSIETERPCFDQKDWTLRARLRGGSFGLVSPSLRYGQKLGERTALSVDGTFMRADGQYPFTLVNGTQKTREKRYNSDIHTWQGEANLYHTFRDSSELQAKAYYYNSERGLPGVVILYNSDARERLWDEHFFAQMVWKKRFSPQWQLQTRLKYTHSWNRYEDFNVKYEGGKQTDIDRQNEYYTSATLGWTPVRNLSFALAEDGVLANLRNNITSQPNPTRYTSLTALSARYRSARLLLDGNVVATYITEHSPTGSVPADRRRLSPSLSASYRLLADESLYVRAMVKNTFRVPTFTDMYYLRIGNTNLRPEKALEYNVGMTWRHLIYNKVDVQVTLDGYYNTVHDKIVAFPTTYVWKMVNFGKVHITGMDVTLAMDIPVSRKVSIDATAAYTLQKAIDKTSPERVSYNDQIPYTARNSGSGSLIVKTAWLNVGYSVKACGERWSMGQNTSEYRLQPYWEHSLTVSRDFQLKLARLSLLGTLLNLTNEQYEIIQYYPMPGRSWQMAATITF